MDNLKLKDRFGGYVEPRRVAQDNMFLWGRFKWQHIRDGKIIGNYDFQNQITNVGRNRLLDVYFGATAKSALWYMGLINNASFTAVSAADTIASHAGWLEWTGYSEATRNLWTPDAASGQSITNTTPLTFTINATGTIKGGFIVDQNTKGGTTGNLWSAGAFGSTVAVVAADLFRGTYTLND